MASLVPSYEYDIFISYRHNDNRSGASTGSGQGWVTDFVNALQEELAATIKEPLSIYFDKNPHDGLLETHSVDKSLEGKLKCLIFIPIISQTYCDPKSFAWQHEFCAFNRLAKEDSFGRDVKLSGGNVASRILPVKIHDIDAEDKALLENELGGVLRPIEFIFKSPGVNRPLTSSDNPDKNLNKTFYRDQVNKTANAIKETITALRNPSSTSDRSSSTQSQGPSTQNPSPSAQPASNRWKIIGALLFLALAATIGYYFYGQRTTTNDLTNLKKSIAVLPFADLSPEGDQEYLGDGIAEEILNVLAQSKELTVIARSSSFQFKGKNEDLRTMGDMLGVAMILEGSVRKYKDHIRVTAQLINVEDGSHLWSKNYDENTDDIFVIQDRIAASVAGALKVTLGGSETSRRINKWDEQAQRLYQQGRYFYDRMGPERTVKAVQLLRQSVELDSSQAISQLYLSNSNGNLGDIDGRERHLDKALKLDPDLSEAHAMRALHYFWDLDFSNALREIEIALSNGQSSPMTQRTAARLYVAWGQPERALAFAKRAIELDPLLTRSLDIAAETFYYAREYADGATILNQALSLDSSDVLLQSLSAIQRNINLDVARRTANRIKDDEMRSVELLWTDIWRGDKGAALRLHQIFDALPQIQMGTQRAELYVMEGKYDSAIDMLEAEYDQGPVVSNKTRRTQASLLEYLSVDPAYDPLRSHPRFKKLIEKMNYPKMN